MVSHLCVDEARDKRCCVASGDLERLSQPRSVTVARPTTVRVGEAHERSVETDVVCLLARRLLRAASNPFHQPQPTSAALSAQRHQQAFPALAGSNSGGGGWGVAPPERDGRGGSAPPKAPRVILMSATLNEQLLGRYFGVPKAAQLDVGVRRHPLTVRHIEDLDALAHALGAPLPPRLRHSTHELARVASASQAHAHAAAAAAAAADAPLGVSATPSDAAVPPAVTPLQLPLAAWLVRLLAARAGARAVLVFVSGLADIWELAEMFEDLAPTPAGAPADDGSVATRLRCVVRRATPSA